MKHDICIIGLGYVGLPLAIEFAKKHSTIGFDVDSDRISQLKRTIDLTGEIKSSELKKSLALFTSKKEEIRSCNTYIVTVPTPINNSKQPDLTALKKASETIGEVIKNKDIVIFESTVYPGCTIEVCIPIIEKKSSLKLNRDFFCGYSPERINPGDKEKTLTKITKIISGSNDEAKKIVHNLYASIITEADIYPVKTIQVAEAAKVIENAQRDLNIAFINELSMIFEKMNLNTYEVLEAAQTKWNFMPFKPGLVGGHCIGVDPYYLTYKSNLLGYSPEVILSGRKLNDSMGEYIAQRVLKKMISNSIIVEESKILVLGFTFKENCPDIRNTKVVDIVKEFRDYKAHVDIYDPWVNKNEVIIEHNLKINSKIPKLQYDAIILAVAHDLFLDIDISKLSYDKTVVFDVKSFLPEKDNLKIDRL